MACGACQFLRKKCADGCIFAPYFSFDGMGIAQFRVIHRVFGASNFSKLLLDLPVDKRLDAALTIFYEAETRLRNPVHGCFSNIFALQKEMTKLNEELAIGYAELAALLNPGQYLSSHITENVNGKQPEISNANSSTTSYEQHYLPLGNQESIPSQHIAINNYHADAAMVGEPNYFTRMLGQHSMSNVERAIDYAELAASLNPGYVNGKQPEIFNPYSTTSPYEQRNLPPGNQESIPSQQVAVNNSYSEAAMVDASNYFPASRLGQHSMSNEEQAIGYAELMASGILEGALLNPGQYLNRHIPDNENGQQSEIFHANNTTSPYEQHHLPRGNQGSIPSQHAAVNNYHKNAAMVDDSKYFPPYNDMSNLSTVTDGQHIEIGAIHLSPLAWNDFR